MNSRIIISAFVALSASLSVQAQHSGKWSLRQCIDYAVVHNISVQQSNVAVSQSEIEMNTYKWSRLPNVTGSASQSWSWGRTASPVDNSYSDTNNSNSNFSLSSDIPLFTGFKIPNQYKLSKLNLKASLADLQKAKDDLSVNIAASYLQALLDKELCKVAEEQIALSQQQLDRLVRMEQIGKVAEAEVAEARATLEQNKLASVQNNNSYRLAMLDLSQLMELPTPEGFEIIQPETTFNPTTLTSPDEIYQIAVTQKASILAAEYRLQGSDLNIKIARSAYMPQLSFGMGLGTNYYTMKGVEASSFGSQLKNNLNKYIGLSLSIPIFDRFSTRNNIRAAKLQQYNYSLQLDNTKKALYKEIQQAWYNALASENKYKSSLSALNAGKASFKLMKEKYENGKATLVEYNESQLKLSKAESELLQAKYDYLFRCKILDFYKGDHIQ